MQSAFRQTSLRETGAELYYIPEDPDDEDEEHKLPELDFEADAKLGDESSEEEMDQSNLPVILIAEE